MNTCYSPHDLLPAPIPRESDYKANYFYENIAKYLVKDTVRICSNGLGIDLDKVEKLEAELTASITAVKESLNKNPIITKFLLEKRSKLVIKKTAERDAKLEARIKQPNDFLKPFNHKDINHRSYFMHLFAQQQKLPEPSELLPTGIPKWPANLVKRLTPQYPLLSRLLDGTLSHPLQNEAMQLMAEHKCEIHNRALEPPNSQVEVDLPDFNPRSSDDKHLLLTGILGHESGKFTDAYETYQRDCDIAYKRGYIEPAPPKNKWSWGRKELELLLDTLTDEYEIRLFKDLIDFSYGDKIQTSFIPAFYRYTVNGRLYSNLRLLGAKSGRFTSSNP